MIALLVLLVLSGFGPPAVAASLVAVDGRDHVELVPMAYRLDEERALGIGDLRAGTAALTLSQRRVNVGFHAGALWARVDLEVAPDAAGEWLLVLGLPNLDRLDVWASWQAGDTPLLRLGDRVPTEAGAVLTRFPYAHVELPAGRHHLWMRAVASTGLALPLTLWRPEAYLATEGGGVLIDGLAATIPFVLGTGAAVLAALSRNRYLAIYAGYTLSFALNSLAATGVGRLLWGRMEVVNDRMLLVSLMLLYLFHLTITLTVLPREHYPRWIGWFFLAVGAMLTVHLVGAVLADDDFRRDALARSLVVVQLVPPLGLWAGLRSWRRGYRPAIYLALANLTYIAVMIVIGGRELGFLPMNTVTYILPLYLPVAESILLASLVASRLRLIQQQEADAQRALTLSMRRHEAELESRVAERTAALDNANAALAAGAAQIRRILEAAPFPIAVTRRADATLLYANRRARGLLAVEDGTVPAMVTPESHCPDADCRAALRAALAADDAVDAMELPLRDGRGRRFWALLSAVAIEHEGEAALLFAVNDITARKDMEHELTKLKELAEANAALERNARDMQRQFVAMISHEFRTPLTVIGMSTQNLAEEIGSGPAGQRLQRIERAVHHMNHMIDTCLLDDRIDGAGLVVRRHGLDLAELAHEIIDTARPAAAGRRLELVRAPLPPVAGDRELLGVVVSNLVDNAVKFAPPDSTVEIAVGPADDRARLTVADRGPGVSREERATVFEKYRRGTGSGDKPGAGLGLYLVRRIVEAHGGTVTVRERTGGGALFEVHLPLVTVYGDPDRGTAVARSAAE